MLNQNEKLKKYHQFAKLLVQGSFFPFEYVPDKDVLCFYDSELNVIKRVEHYMEDLEHTTCIIAEDRQKLISFYQDGYKKPVELRAQIEGSLKMLKINVVKTSDENGVTSLLGYMEDVTEARQQEKSLRHSAMRDSLSGLYNHAVGEELIREYLDKKDPYSSCALLVVDIDYFKDVNDNFGHMFGDEVIQSFAVLMKNAFPDPAVIFRLGGDEFVILAQEVTHGQIINRTMELLESVRSARFENNYRMTCSIGVCYLPENVTGYTYSQLFENADWALYRAKENGRDQYAFCDNLRRFEAMDAAEAKIDTGMDPRYFRNDIRSTAFEIFEKSSNFTVAVNLLMKVVGERFSLDRITVIRTNVKKQTVSSPFQWESPRAPKVLEEPDFFDKEDFLLYFNEQDRYGTIVFQADEDLSRYSEGARRLILQGKAKTALYCSIYSEGRYIGAISYVSCETKRFWSPQLRREFGELSKIIAAHMTRYLEINSEFKTEISFPEYDRLTGLLSFTRFREEIEQIIVGGFGPGHAVVYTDIENFRYYNQKFGFIEGDRLLRQFSNYISGTLKSEHEVYFARAHADQFIIFLPAINSESSINAVKAINEEFINRQKQKNPEVQLRIRTGIYFIDEECPSASWAIDCANNARKHIVGDPRTSVYVYDEKLKETLRLRAEIIRNMPSALKNEEFVIHLQPIVRLEDYSVVGSEALVRWKKPDGTLLYPDTFIPVYEYNGKIIDLDMYVFGKAAQFLARIRKKGGRVLPISVNASAILANETCIEKLYEQMINKYDLSPKLFDIEITETAAAENFNSVKLFMEKLSAIGFDISVDDFGSGYSIMNALLNMKADTIKLDRGFLNTCEKSEKGLEFLEQTVATLKKIGCRVLCEGIETEEQAERMKNFGCDMGQGYWFAKPMPAEEFARKYLLNK